MASFSGMRSVRVSAESHRVTTFELFFDLVFVFAFTQVTRLMAHEHSAYGFLQGIIILALLWWCWVSYSWLANQAHADEGILQLGMLVAMGGVFIAALAIPEAFEDLEGGISGPIVLALAYTVVRVAHICLYIVAADDDKELRAQVIKTSFGMLFGCTLLIIGSLFGGEVQTYFWMAGLVSDLVLTYATSSGGNWRIHSAAHWSERYGLVLILALGESIVAIGVGASRLPIDFAIIAGSLLGVGLSMCLWWLYFAFLAPAAEHVLARLGGKARAALAVDAYTYIHLAMIAGIIISALGVETALEHIGETESFGWFGAAHLIGGTALYLVGLAAFWRRAGGRWKMWRLTFAAILLALMPVGAVTPALVTMAVVFGVCMTLVVFEAIKHASTITRVRGAV